jgi:hypothetical protein
MSPKIPDVNDYDDTPTKRARKNQEMGPQLLSQATNDFIPHGGTGRGSALASVRSTSKPKGRLRSDQKRNS